MNLLLRIDKTGLLRTFSCKVSTQPGLKGNQMKKIVTAIVLAAALSAPAHAQTLLAGWDFQTTTTGGTAGQAAPSSPLVYVANFGTGSLYLDGTSGSSVWTSAASSPQVTAFGGSDVNTAGTPFSTVTSGASALALANSSANGNRIVFTLNMTGYEDLAISYATQSTNTGFSLQTWSYSTDGVSFSDFATFAPGGGSGGTVSFATNGIVTLDTSALSIVDGQPTVFVGVTFSGATATAGNNRLDNIAFTAIPEPSTYLLLGLGTAFMIWNLRRRRSAQA